MRIKWNWLTANDKFKRCRNKYEGARVAVNTRIKQVGSDPGGASILAMSYCGTELVRWYPDGRIQVRTDGWNTVTTKRRVFEYSGVTCASTRGHHSFVNVRNDRLHLAEIVDDGEWKTLHRNSNGQTYWVGANGQPVEGVVRVAANKARSKKRNPFTKLCAGDVLISPEGKHYFTLRAHRSSPMKLVRYFGDPAENRARLSYDDEIEVNELFALAMQAGGWTAGSRFKGDI